MSNIPYIYEIEPMLEQFSNSARGVEELSAIAILSSAMRQGTSSFACDRQVSCLASFMKEALCGEIRFLTPDVRQFAP